MVRLDPADVEEIERLSERPAAWVRMVVEGVLHEDALGIRRGDVMTPAKVLLAHARLAEREEALAERAVPERRADPYPDCTHPRDLLTVRPYATMCACGVRVR